MENIGDRIKIIVDDTNLSIAEFSSQVGIQRSSLSHLFSGRNKPSIDLLLKIKKQFPATDLEWLITGERLTTTAVIIEDIEKDSKKEPSRLVTSVTKSSSETDNQGIDDVYTKNTDLSQDTPSIDKIVMFYSNGSFKEYNPDA